MSINFPMAKTASDIIPITEANIKSIFLAEFEPCEPVKELIDAESNDTKNTYVMSGLRLFSVYSHAGIVAKQNEDNVISLEWFDESAILAVAQPHRNGYFWKLMELNKTAKADLCAVRAIRDVTPEETELLNAQYPGWLDACKKLDDEIQAQISQLPINAIASFLN